MWFSRRVLDDRESHAGKLVNDWWPMLNGGVHISTCCNRDCICLVLDDIRLLFHGPGIDPLGGRYHGLSGIDLIIRQLNHERRSHPRLRLEIVLPAPGISPDTVAHVEQSLASYCEAQAGQLRQKLHDIWLEARRALLTGSIFLAVCLLLSSVIDETCPFSPFLNRLFSESFLIVGWVAMWRPIELSLYEWWPFRHELRVYERIGKMPLSIMAAPDPTSSVILAL
ncbi:hypothetical protein ATN81_24330 [Agrobacterium pusense]|jgi:hypothetical protein|nr:hypothetical protein BA939_14835 [Rhizobium sp. S41]MCD4661189.1 hypothetical protein [Agrobacterium sp.]OJH52308.1 hypothetical protein ATN81_24330 [Agrobacterium pusense]OJH56959.1 hypothetical protein BA725_24670 [Agrobacterium pusense]